MLLHNTWRLCARHLSSSRGVPSRPPLPWSPPPPPHSHSLASAHPPPMTPIMNQYFSFKRDPQYGRNCVVLFQLGGFYEAFFSDAEVVSTVCGVVLTTKGQSLYQGAPIEMAGVPVDRCDTHVGKLLRRGYRVVMVDQTEGLLAAAAGRAVAPKSGGAASHTLPTPGHLPSSVLGRAVSRVFTPGTASPEFLGASPMGHHYTAALAFGAHPLGSLALAACDVATGEVQVRLLDVADLGAALASVAPIELVLPTDSLCEVGPPIATGRSVGGGTGMTLEAALRMFAREGSKATSSSSTDSSFTLPASSLSSPALHSHRRHGLQALEEALVASPSLGSQGGGGGGVLKLPLPGGDTTFLTLFPATGFTAREGLRACAQLAVHSGGGEEDYAEFSDLELSAVGGLMSYIKWTHVGVALPRLSQPIKVLTPGPDTGIVQLSQVTPPVVSSHSMGDVGEADAGSIIAAAAPSSSAHPHGLLPSPSPPISPHTLFRPPPRMRINEATAAALELVRPNHRPRRSPGCLLARIDRCRTHMGSRLLDGRVCAPLASLTPILHRLDAVAGFLARDGGGAEAVLVRGAVRTSTGKIGDLERAFQRVAATPRPSPRDLCTLRDGLLEAQKLGYLLASWDPSFSAPQQPPSPLQQQQTTTIGATPTPPTSPALPLIIASQSRALEAFPHPTLPTRPAELPLYLLLASQSHFDVLWEGSSPVSTHPSGSHCLSLATAVLAWPWDGGESGEGTTACSRDFSAWDSPPAAVSNAHGSFTLLGKAVRELCAALVSDSSNGGGGGGDGGGGEGGGEGSSNFIRKGYDPELDAARALARDTGEVQSALEEEFRGVFGLGRGANSVRVRRMEKEGYVLEVDVKVKGVRERLESVLKLQRVEEEARTMGAAPRSSGGGGSYSKRATATATGATAATASSTTPPPSILESLLQLEGGSLSVRSGGASSGAAHGTTTTPTTPPPPPHIAQCVPRRPSSDYAVMPWCAWMPCPLKPVPGWQPWKAASCMP